MSDRTEPLLPHEEPLPPRLDLYIAAVFLMIGIGVVVLALQMPTFKEQLGEIYTAPGLVPSVHGAVIALLSLWLAVRSIRRGALAVPIGAPAQREGHSNARLALAAVLCLVFTGALIGRMPFWLAAALFVSSFIILFEWRSGASWAERMKPILIAVAIGLGTGWAVTLVFGRLFLVRLP
jgi:hypothetical protein